MKNARIQPLVILTCIFIGFVTGMFFSRTRSRTPVYIQKIPAATVSPASPTVESVPAAPAIININTATAEQFQSLPGIGPVLAERIVAYRNANGMFESVGALMNVSGIGETKLEAIWDLVTIGG